jgi:hypothetical protein
MELNQPKHIISLATSAVLVSVDVNVWSATKQDRGISAEVTSAKKADSNAGRFVKNLLADDPTHKKLSNYRQTVYNWVKRATYRWNNSQDLLPVAMLPKFKAEYHEHEKNFASLLDEFLNKYPNIISDMAFKQGDMFDRSEYPTAEQIRNKFGIKLYVAEVPTNDFRCNIAQDLADDLKAHYEGQAQEIVSSVMVDATERLVDYMQRIKHCCGYDEVSKSGTDETTFKKRKIYDTTIQQAKEQCEVLKSFNLTNNPELAEASASLEKLLADVSAEDLRESDAVRSNVGEGIDSILSKFGSLTV